MAGVLGFVFQYVRPLVAQAEDQLLIGFERLESQADQIIKINRATVVEGTLVIGV